jgi:hypothetical protein
MIKYSKHIRNMDHGATSIPELPPVAFNATEEKEETTPCKGLQIDTSKLDNEEMALIIKSFRQILKQRKGEEYKPRSKRVCYRCGKSDHYIVKCSYASDVDRDEDKKGKKKVEKKKHYHKKKGGEAHVVREWDSVESSTDSSSDEDAANIAVNKGLLFPNIGHKCLMAKEGKRKVKSRTIPNTLLSMMRVILVIMKKPYPSTSKASTPSKFRKILSSINEKGDVLECQEELLTVEHDKYVKLEKALAHEKGKCKNLTNKLKTCNTSVFYLKYENMNLCHTRVSGHQDPSANIITRCTGTKSHTYDESWHMIECHNFTT